MKLPASGHSGGSEGEKVTEERGGVRRGGEGWKRKEKKEVVTG